MEQASTVTASPEGPYELYDYVISLREGIMDAWGGIIGAMKSSGKSEFPNVFYFRLSMLILVQPKLSSNTLLLSSRSSDSSPATRTAASP